MIELIQPFLAPAILISAGGMLCLAQFGRFTAILSRVRDFNHERLTLIEKLQTATEPDRGLIEQRTRELERQARVVMSHGRTVRNALRSLVAGLLAMVTCSLAIGGASLVPLLGHLALGIFVLGLLFFFAGLCLVLSELKVSMSEIEFEHENLARLRSDGVHLLPPEEAS